MIHLHRYAITVTRIINYISEEKKQNMLKMSLRLIEKYRKVAKVNNLFQETSNGTYYRKKNRTFIKLWHLCRIFSTEA